MSSRRAVRSADAGRGAAGRRGRARDARACCTGNGAPNRHSVRVHGASALLVLAQPLCATLLYFALLPPTTAGRSRHAGRGQRRRDRRTTRCRQRRRCASSRCRRRRALADVERVPDLATALRRHPGTQRVRVVGAGLEARDRDAVRGLALEFAADALPRGLVELDAPRAGRRRRASSRSADARERPAWRLRRTDRSGRPARRSRRARRRRSLHADRDHARAGCGDRSCCACAMRSSRSSKTSNCRCRSTARSGTARAAAGRRAGPGTQVPAPLGARCRLGAADADRRRRRHATGRCTDRDSTPPTSAASTWWCSTSAPGRRSARRSAPP